MSDHTERPLAIDLFCGLGGWAEGFLAEGFNVIGFDNVRRPYPGSLVLQDVDTIHGSQFAGAAAIVASPPCQTYSWLSLPWSRSTSTSPNCARAQALRKKWETEGPDNRLFDACFRIQREAIQATSIDCPKCEGWAEDITDQHCSLCGGTGELVRHIPLIVENVRGAQEWVGQSRYVFGPFNLWGDIPALMPRPRKGEIKQGGDWFNAGSGGISRSTGSKSAKRAQFSAEAAKIPLALSQHIAAALKPRDLGQVRRPADAVGKGL